MEESLTVLMEAKECPEDELLVSLVKIQLVMDKVYHLRRDGDNKTPSVFYTKAFQSQLECVKEQIPQHLKQDSEFTNVDHLKSLTLTQFNRSDTVVPGQCGTRHSRSSHPNTLLTKCSRDAPFGEPLHIPPSMQILAGHLALNTPRAIHGHSIYPLLPVLQGSSQPVQALNTR